MQTNRPIVLKASKKWHFLEAFNTNLTFRKQKTEKKKKKVLSNSMVGMTRQRMHGVFRGKKKDAWCGFSFTREGFLLLLFFIGRTNEGD